MRSGRLLSNFVELFTNFLRTFVEFMPGCVDICQTFVELLSNKACFGAEEGFYDFTHNSRAASCQRPPQGQPPNNEKIG